MSIQATALNPADQVSIQKTLSEREATYKGKFGPVQDHPDSLISPIRNAEGEWQVGEIHFLPKLGHKFEKYPVLLVRAPDGSTVPVTPGLAESDCDGMVVAQKVGKTAYEFFKPINLYRQLEGTQQVYESTERYNYSLHGFRLVEIAKGEKVWVDSRNLAAMKAAKTANCIFACCSYFIRT